MSDDAWCRVPTSYGTVLVTNSFESCPDGVDFVAVDDHAGRRVGWWATGALGSVESVSSMLISLAEATDADVAWDEEFEEEYHVALAHGSLRICVIGSYLRLLDAHGEGLDHGAAYWCDAELASDPSRCWGAVLGAVASVSA